MKIFLLLVVSLALSGCIKEYCWTCETTYHTTYSDGKPADDISFSESICDYDETEIEDYEETSSRTTTVTSGGVIMVTTITTKCTR